MASGVLLEIQPEDIDPVEFTHFDQWKVDPRDGDADDCADEMKDVISTWEKTLGCSLDAFVDDNFGGSYYQALSALGTALFFDLIIVNLLRAGFDVFEGDGYIEIYKGDEAA